MNPTHDEENLIRWLDGEMDEAERARFEAKLAADPLLGAEAMEMKSMSAMLRKNLPQPGEIPHADFFNSEIQRQIQEIRYESTRPVAEERKSVFEWLRLPWLVAAAAALVAVLAVMRPHMGPGGTTQVVSSYAPNPGVTWTVSESAEARATVLMLDGLPEIPASTPMVGYNVHHSETDPQMAMTTLFSESGQVLMVMAKDNRNQPKFWTSARERN